VGPGDRRVLLCLQGRGEARTAGEEPKKEEEGAGGPNTDLSVEFGKSTGTHAKVASPPSTTKRTRTRRLPPSRPPGGFWDHPEDVHHLRCCLPLSPHHSPHGEWPFWQFSQIKSDSSTSVESSHSGVEQWRIHLHLYIFKKSLVSSSIYVL
jgi:hypothetical protein